ncbi:MAG: PilZ domain-containing protein [Spirochaetales bacterium]
MGVTTSQQLQSYFDAYGSVEVTFNKEVTQLLSFLQEKVFLKVAGVDWPCLLYSSSLVGAKIVLTLKPEQISRLEAGSPTCQLRYGFRNPDSPEPVVFFTNVKIKAWNRYNNGAKNDLYFMTLEFTTRPPEDLIEILGRFLEANVNSQKRRDERITVNEVSIKKLGFTSCNAIVAVEKIDRKCLVRDLSFGGAQVLLPGVAKFLENRAIVLRLTVEETGQVLSLAGKILRVETLAGRRDITQSSLQFEDAAVPHQYKVLINEALRLQKTKQG